METNTYSVYMHVSPSNKVYIGITKQKPKYRWNNGRGYISNKLFSRAINKYGWDNFQHIILFSNMTEKDAKAKEIELIAKYNATNPQCGYNITLGGESWNGYKPSKEKIRRGFHLSEEQKKRISLSEKGKPKPKPIGFSETISKIKRGTKHSNKTKVKMRESRLRWTKDNFDTILQVNQQGVITNKWNNQSEAYRALGFIQSTFQLHVSNGKLLKGYYYIKEKDYNEKFNNKLKQLELW